MQEHTVADPSTRSSVLVYAYLFSDTGQGIEIDCESASNWLMSKEDKFGAFLWLHFDNPHGISTQWLTLLDLPTAFSEALHKERRSSRMAHSQLNLFATVNEVTYDFERRTQPEVATIWLNVKQHSLLSAWDQPLKSVKLLRQKISEGQPFHSPLALLNWLLRRQSEDMFGVLRGVAKIANEIENSLRTNKLPKHKDLGGIRGDLVGLQRLLAPEPASLFRLITRPPKWIDNEDIQSLHLSTENFSVALRDMAVLQERIKILEDNIAARVAERTNRSVFVLTSVTVVSLPITVLAALFGMNIGGIPFSQDVHGFWWVVWISVFATLSAGWLIYWKLLD